MRKEGFRIAWVCDPMHGNTHVTRAGRKTRVFESIVRELRSLWQIHEAEGSVAAGVHIELTGEDVTECVGGSGNLADSDLGRNYQTHCDPRLNCEQAVELAFEIADILAPKEGSQNDMVPGS
jgi:3-deoxy-7-phosphoheptulonate synthase